MLRTGSFVYGLVSLKSAAYLKVSLFRPPILNKILRNMLAEIYELVCGKISRVCAVVGDSG
jgi:hypothetical protein